MSKVKCPYCEIGRPLIIDDVQDKHITVFPNTSLKQGHSNCDSDELAKLRTAKTKAEKELRKIKEDLNQIYGSTFHVNYNSEFVETISKVEQVLGFKLYFWQKTYIANGKFRRYGETTAKILKELLDTDEEPIDYRRPPIGLQERIYRDELIATKKKLDIAGIKTRDVLLKYDWRHENND